eukprot:6208220-Pleurochrysis_carterae.AAC.1
MAEWANAEELWIDEAGRDIDEIGCTADETARAARRRLPKECAFRGGFVGYFGYEVRKQRARSVLNEGGVSMQVGK